MIGQQQHIALLIAARIYHPHINLTVTVTITITIITIVIIIASQVAPFVSRDNCLTMETIETKQRKNI